MPSFKLKMLRILKFYSKEIFMILPLTCILLWVINGSIEGDKEMKIEKSRIIKKKVLYPYRVEGDKIIKLKFTDSTEYSPLFNSFNDHISIGDSLSKDSGALRYVIYNGDNYIDSFVIDIK